jgi:hypothetical protein
MGGGGVSLYGDDLYMGEYLFMVTTYGYIVSVGACSGILRIILSLVFLSFILDFAVVGCVSLHSGCFPGVEWTSRLQHGYSKGSPALTGTHGRGHAVTMATH